MSSNSNHINITRSNYEEYLLLYVDNELNPSERAAVEAFLQLHPDLQAELELLQSVILPSEEISINKEELFAENMRFNSIDEKLLLFVDDELSTEEKAKVALEIEENKTTEAQYQLLLKTKLDKNETMVYPNKEELYRRTERRAFEWLQIAAAVLIILMGGWFWMQSSSNTSSANITPLAKANPVTTETKQETKATDETLNTVATTTEVKVEDNNEVVTKLPTEKTIAVVKTTNTRTQQVVINPAIATTGTQDGNETNTTIDVPVQRNNSLDAMAAVNTTTVKTSEPIINTSLVTSAPTIRTTYKEPVTDDNNSGGKSIFKGVLRKATRFIERTTGIPATNENNEVLIASVAVRLD